MIKHPGNISDAIKAIEKVENATSHIYYDAKNDVGIFDNVTYTLKTNFATKTGESNASSRILENFVAGYDSTVVRKMDKVGAALIAKTHADELALGGTGLNSGYGIIKNPINNERIVGGSSAGAAATLVDGVTIAIGSDTGDSVRKPASYNGLYGFKPSYGAISRYGLYAFATSLDTVGLFAHNVNDIIEVSAQLYGFDKNDLTSRNIDKPKFEERKPLKIAILKNIIDLYDEPYKSKFLSFVEDLKKDGIKIIEKEIDMNMIKAIPITYQVLSFSEASSNLANLDGINFGQRINGNNYNEIMTNTRSNKFGSLLQRRLTLGAYFLSHENQKDVFLRAQKVRRLIVNEFNKIYDEADFILSISSTIAPKINDVKSQTNTSIATDYMIHSNFEGSPSISIPFSKYKNMPYGIIFDARQDNDKNLLSASLYIEKMLRGENE